MIKVVKIGGNVLDDEEATDRFCRDFVKLGGGKVLVHGGGALASRLQKQLGQEPVKIEGRRVTDADTLQAVTMTYAGWINKTLVAKLQALGCNAIGLAGCDGSVITATRRAPRTLSDGKTVVDYGFVGDVTPMSVNTQFLQMLVDAGITPVLCAINHDGHGQLLNTNADTMASSVAGALEGMLVCCFEMDGVLLDKDDPSSVIATIDRQYYGELKASGVVDGGMLPKIDNCFDALAAGASSAVIKNAARLLEPSGTTITL